MAWEGGDTPPAPSAPGSSCRPAGGRPAPGEIDTVPGGGPAESGTWGVDTWSSPVRFVGWRPQTLPKNEERITQNPEQIYSDTIDVSKSYPRTPGWPLAIAWSRTPTSCLRGVGGCRPLRSWHAYGGDQSPILRKIGGPEYPSPALGAAATAPEWPRPGAPPCTPRSVGSREGRPERARCGPARRPRGTPAPRAPGSRPACCRSPGNVEF